MIGSTNVALNAPATQLSTTTYTNASMAVDGSRETRAFTIAVNGIQSWWAVDLGSPRHINVVQVDPRWIASLREYSVL